MLGARSGIGVVLGVLGVLSLALTLGLLFSSVNTEGLDCGSVISPEDQTAFIDQTDLEDLREGVEELRAADAACKNSRDDRRTAAIAVGVLGLILLIGGIGLVVTDDRRTMT